MNILVVDDTKSGRLQVAKLLTKLGHSVVECESGEQALAVYKSGDFPMVLTDIQMPGMSGLELLRRIKVLPNKDAACVVLITAYSDVDTAISALRAGAYDYLTKPIISEELLAVTERVAEYQGIRREYKHLSEHLSSEISAATSATVEELKRLRKMLAKTLGMGQLGIYSEVMGKIMEQAQKYHTDRTVPVLIQGETGTGKEVIARLIHFGEECDTAPFADINCAALTANLFESELFGYEAGAFTGGNAKGQKGKIDLAEGGTLFLDEIGELPLELQGKLLRVLQEKEFYRVGGFRKIKTNIRVVCATNVDLAARVSQGGFRSDLYYRLKVGQITIPPLRERREEILPLAQMFLDAFAQEKKKHFRGISAQAAKMLQEYLWPGNVRELKNCIEWAVFMFDDSELRASHLESMIRHETGSTGLKQSTVPGLAPAPFNMPHEKFSLERFVDSVILSAYDQHAGNKTKAANYLDMSLRAFSYRLDKVLKRQEE